MYKYTLITLLALASATGPFDWQRNFFVGMYTGFIGDPGQLYYNCLPDTEQYELQDSFIQIAKDYQDDSTLTKFFADILAVGDDLWKAYDVCMVYTYTDALADTILK